MHTNYAYKHTYTHKHIDTHKHTHAYTRTRTRTHTHAHTHTHTHTHKQHKCAFPPSITASPPQQHPLSRPKLLLGIESSCDDTGAAVVTSEGRVLGEDIAGQADIHAPWGGLTSVIACAITYCAMYHAHAHNLGATPRPCSVCNMLLIERTMPSYSTGRRMLALKASRDTRDCRDHLFSRPYVTCDTFDITFATDKHMLTHVTRAPALLPGRVTRVTRGLACSPRLADQLAGKTQAPSSCTTGCDCLHSSSPAGATPHSAMPAELPPAEDLEINVGRKWCGAHRGNEGSQGCRQELALSEESESSAWLDTLTTCIPVLALHRWCGAQSGNGGSQGCHRQGRGECVGACRGAGLSAGCGGSHCGAGSQPMPAGESACMLLWILRILLGTQRREANLCCDLRKGRASQLDAVALMLGSWGYDLWEEGERRAQITRREDTSRSAECRGSHSGARALHVLASQPALVPQASQGPGPVKVQDAKRSTCATGLPACRACESTRRKIMVCRQLEGNGGL
eukprot:1136973-Pelagomonas_calceolata.AAC.4